MASTAKGIPADPPRHDSGLEEIIQSLRSSLQHWHTWDAEYEALKEEVTDLTNSASPAALVDLKNAFSGELVDQKEVDDIFGKAAPKSKGQIINVLERRLDYVGQNVRTLMKQLAEAEDKYASTMVSSHSDATDEDGHEVKDIVEELDESGNVLSYSLNTPGQSMPHVRKALEKAGVKDPVQESPGSQTEPSSSPAAISHSAPESSPQALKANASASNATAPKKTVAFAEDSKPAEDESPHLSRNAKRVDAIMQTAKAQESIKDPIIPEDETPEDATLRQDMLRYGLGEMSEVSAVVAELQLEEGSSEDDDWNFSDEGYDDEDDGEDAYGRNTGRVVTEDYAKRMLELETKLGIQSRFTDAAGAATEEDNDSESDDERVGQIVINHGSADPTPAQMPQPVKSSIKEAGKSNGSKGVRFAAALDIAPEHAQPATGRVSAAPEPAKEDVVEPLGDVIERKPAGPVIASSPDTTSRRTSRFKRDELSSPSSSLKGPLDAPPQFLDYERDDVPTGPEGKTIADTLVEKEPPTEPGPLEDDFDDSNTFQEIADEHQRMRRKFVHRQGGFLKEDESPVQPLDEESGGRETLSRFKAARLSRQ